MIRRDGPDAATQPDAEAGLDETAGCGQSIPSPPAVSRSTIRALARQTSSPSDVEPDYAACKYLALAQTTLAVTHDFNNILMVMGGLLEPALEKNDPDALKENHEALRKMVNQLAALCRHLQQASRNNPDAEHEDVEIMPLVREIVSAHLAHSDIQVRLLGDEDIAIRINRVVLLQILQNLVLNARQAMPRGGELFISANALDTLSSPCVMVIVADQGHGIDPVDLPRIFEMSFTTRQNGHGIGLAFVKSAMDKLNGQIAVRSRVDEGTTFTLLFPLTPPDEAKRA